MIFAFDTETYYDDEYSLNRMSTEAYVRDPRFKLHCWALSWRDADGTLKKVWRSGDTLAKYGRFFAEHTIIAHHAQFDGLILSHHFGIKPLYWIDTYSMAKGLFPREAHSLAALAAKYRFAEKTVPYNLFRGVRDLPPDILNQLGEGCAHDAALALAIFEQMRGVFPREEYAVIDQTVRMFTEPTLLLDIERCEAFMATTHAEKTTALQALGTDKTELGSSAKFAELLRKRGIEPQTKPGKAGPVFAFAKTDKFMKELLEHDDPVVKALASARLGVKSTLNETRAVSLVEMAKRGALTIYLNYCGAHTTRWSGGDDANFQNFPRGGELRKCIIAPPGRSLVIGDLAQIEARLLDWFYGQLDACENWRAGIDQYSLLASDIYGRSITKENKNERHLGKVLKLGCGYGMGAQKFQWTCAQGALGGPPIYLTLEQASNAVGTYRSRHRAVVDGWADAGRLLSLLYTKGTGEWNTLRYDRGVLYLPNGLGLDYTSLHYEEGELVLTNKKGETTRMYGAKLTENVIQALARVVISQGMIRQARKYRCIWTVHDEIVSCVPDADAEDCMEYMKKSLTDPLPWCKDAPLAADLIVAKRYEK